LFEPTTTVPEAAAVGASGLLELLDEEEQPASTAHASAAARAAEAVREGLRGRATDKIQSR
jgi:hypothetical protein